MSWEIAVALAGVVTTVWAWALIRPKPQPTPAARPRPAPAPVSKPARPPRPILHAVPKTRRIVDVATEGSSSSVELPWIG